VDTTDRAARTAISILGGILLIVAMMLLWGAFVYRGYGEDAPNEALSALLVLSGWAWGTVAAFVGARYLRGYEWLAGIVVLAAGLPIIILTGFAITVAACSGNWFGHSCMFS
jgi:hypothetical protein